jgi:ankyrin repeat protein
VADRSPISWAIAARKLDIARFLIFKGADVHSLSSKGWTPVFYLFGGLGSSKGSSKALDPPTEYLQLFAGSSFKDFDAQDRAGWTSMHRAAIHGTGEDIRALSSFHASPFLKTKRLQWPAIFMAIYYSNLSTFKELAKIHPNYIQERDLRGWTALHVAAGAGNEEVISMILRDGGDVHARAEATTYMVPEPLRYRDITPADVAKDAGRESYLTYIRAVTAHDAQVEVVEDDGVKEMFWQAV